MLECNRADTGVGPSMADGSHGCKPNCADFPVAAKSNPIRGSVLWFVSVMKICCKSQEFVLNRKHAMVSTKPISPIRL